MNVQIKERIETLDFSLLPHLLSCTSKLLSKVRSSTPDLDDIEYSRNHLGEEILPSWIAYMLRYSYSFAAFARPHHD